MQKIKRKYSIIISAVSLITAACILMSCLLFLKKDTAADKSFAYLYSKDTVEIDYNVAQLLFDLKSNHLFKYYEDSDTTDTDFRTLLEDLSDLVTEFELIDQKNSTVINEFNLQIKNALFGYYGAMITELDNAWESETLTDVSTPSYSEYVLESVYKKYYKQFNFLFKMTGISKSSINSDFDSIWYNYAKDLLTTYYEEYTVLQDATETNQSTLNIGVKLRGATTFSDDPHGTYYDENFNEMVSAFTMKFENTSSVSIYLKLNIAFQNNEVNDTGILGMLLPYGMTWESLNAVDSAYNNTTYKTTSGKWKYRELIVAIINGENDFTPPDTVSTTLSYSALKSLLNAWNTYAIGTYINDSNTVTGNFVVDRNSNVDASMLFFADYEHCADYYRTNEGTSTDADYATGKNYLLLKRNFSVTIQTSLKNVDFANLTENDWTSGDNKMDEYNNLYAGVSNFECWGAAYFVKNGDIHPAADYMHSGYIECLYGDKDINEVNYFKNLRFDIYFRGYSPARIRVSLLEQFTNSNNEIVAVNQLKFNLASGWYDNRANDMYFYSNDEYASTIRDYKVTRQIRVIDGIAADSAAGIDPELASEQDYTFKILIQVEAVQPNRVEEFWQMTPTEIDGICTTTPTT